VLGDVPEPGRQAAGRFVHLTQRDRLYGGGHTHRPPDGSRFPCFGNHPLAQPPVRLDGGKHTGQQPDQPVEERLRGNRHTAFGPHHTDRGHLPQLHGRGDALSTPFFVRQLLYTSFLLTSEKIM